MREHADEALRLARRLGLPRLAGQIEEFLASIGHGRLSSRELEIARLVAAGRTNRGIGQDLHLSERTVESHVTHVLHKLGLDSRAAVAAWVAGGGRD